MVKHESPKKPASKLQSLIDHAASKKLNKPANDKLTGSKPLQARRVNPLTAIKITGNTEKDDAAEVEVIEKELTSIDASTKFGNKTGSKIMGNAFWLALVFTTEDQRNEFVRKSGWLAHSDNTGMYYNGLGIAEELGVDLTPENVPFRERGPDKLLVEQVGIIIPGKD